MLDFSTPLSSLGGAAGAGLGGAVGGILGGVNDVLSAPRRLLWKGASSLVGQDIESGDDLMGAFGLDTENPLVKALGMGAEVLGDPLTYAGGLLGKLGGAALGAKAGKGLEAAAVARGPNYAGGVEKFAAAGTPTTRRGQELLEALNASPHAERIAGELPQGSTFLDNGQQALIYRTPAGDTLRIAPHTTEEIDRLARPAIDQMLPVTRAGLIGDAEAGFARVERAPYADRTPFGATTHETPVMRRGGDTAVSPRRSPLKDIFANQQALKDSVRSQGYWPADLHTGNMAMYEGRPVVIDPGAVLQAEGGPALAALPDWSAKQPGRLTNWLLDRLGADGALQAELDQGAGGAARALTDTVATSAAGSTPSKVARFLGDERGSLDLDSIRKYLGGQLGKEEIGANTRRGFKEDIFDFSAPRVGPGERAQHALASEWNNTEPVVHKALGKADREQALFDQAKFHHQLQQSTAVPHHSTLGELFDVYDIPYNPKALQPGSHIDPVTTETFLSRPNHLLHELGHHLDEQGLLPANIYDVLGTERGNLVRGMNGRTASSYEMMPREIMANLFSKAASGKISPNFPQTSNLLLELAQKVAALRG